MHRHLVSPIPTGSPSTQDRFMLALSHQEQAVVEIKAKMAVDEVTKQRWDRVAGFVDGMFDMSHEIGSWLNRETFVDYYTAVYDFCTAKRVSPQSDGAHQQFLYGEHLYDLLAVRIAENFRHWSADINSQPDLNSFVAAYLEKWARFREMLEHFEAVFSYLERFLIDVKLENRRADDQVRFEYLRPLLMKHWSYDIIYQGQTQLFSAIQCAWDTSIADTTSGAIVLVVQSFKTLSMPMRLGPNKTPTSSDLKVFEMSLLPWYVVQVSRKSAERLEGLILSGGSIDLTQVGQLHVWFEQECQRASRFLGDEVIIPVKDTLKTSLLQPVIDPVYSLFQLLISDEEDPIDALKLIYSVVSLRRTLIKPMSPYFERGLLKRASLTLISGDNKEYFVGLLSLYNLSDNILSMALGNNSDLKQARNAAFTRLFASVSPGAFALWIDNLLILGDAGSLVTIPHLVQFIEDRNGFRTAYQRLLANRLLAKESYLTMEEQLLNGMKEALTASFCQPLEKMLQDVMSNQEHKHDGRKRAKAAYETDVLVLTSTVWPIEPAGDGFAALNIPVQFQHLCASYEKHYKEKHSRRNLYWHPLLSGVQVEMTIGASGARTYTINMSLAQWTVLDSLSYESQDIASVSLKSGLAPELILQALQPLMTVGLVSNTLSINSSFSQPSEVLDFMPGHHSRTGHTHGYQSTEDLTSEICGPDHANSSLQIYLIQAAIIRHLKAVTTSTITLITKFVIEALAGRCTPTKDDVVVALKSLESREFIKHDPRKPSHYQYVP